MMAAHITENDSSLWKRLGDSCKNIGNMEQALYCFQKASKYDSKNVNSLWEQAVIHRDHGRIGHAINDFKQILQIIPNTMVFLKNSFLACC